MANILRSPDDTYLLNEEEVASLSRFAINHHADIVRIWRGGKNKYVELYYSQGRPPFSEIRYYTSQAISWSSPEKPRWKLIG